MALEFYLLRRWWFYTYNVVALLLKFGDHILCLMMVCWVDKPL